MNDQVTTRRRHRNRLRTSDVGTTFIEVLVATVLLGLGGVAVLTGLQVSITGSDQHKSKVGALSEIEGAGAYLQREAIARDCRPGNLATAGYYQDHLDGTGPIAFPRPGTRNDGVTVLVTNVSCTTGLPVVTLFAGHAKGNATERMDVVVGGISVLKNGDGTGGPAGPVPGPCVWGSASTTPVSVNKSGNQLAEPVTIRLTYTGSCSSATASAFLSQPAPSPRSTTLTMSPGGVFNAPLDPNAVNWKREVVNVTITTNNPSGTFTTTFTVT